MKAERYEKVLLLTDDISARYPVLSSELHHTNLRPLMIENISVGTWNVRTLRPAGKLEQLTHAMGRYHWNKVGLCEMRQKNFVEMSTDDGHKVNFSGEEDKHVYGV